MGVEVVLIEDGGGHWTVAVTNTGAIVEEFRLDVLGAPAAAARLAPATLSLFPSAQGTAEVEFDPRLLASLPPGDNAFAVRATGTQTGDGAVAEASIEIAGIGAITAEVLPHRSRGRREGEHRVELVNRGNASVPVTIEAFDRDEILDISVGPDRLVVGPGESATAKLVVRPVDDLKGQQPFAIRVIPAGEDAIELDAAFEKEALAWKLPVLALVAVMALLVAALVLRGGTEGRSDAKELAGANEVEETTTTAFGAPVAPGQPDAPAGAAPGAPGGVGGPAVAGPDGAPAPGAGAAVGPTTPRAPSGGPGVVTTQTTRPVLTRFLLYSGKCKSGSSLAAICQGEDVASPVFSDGAISFQTPSWAPDATYAMWAGSDGSLWRGDPRNGSKVKLATPAGTFLKPVISSGRVFVMKTVSGSTSLVSYPMGGGTTSLTGELSHGTGVASPAASYDGQWLAWVDVTVSNQRVAFAKVSEVMAGGTGTAARRTCTTQNVLVGDPTFTANNARIVYTARTADLQIYTANLDHGCSGQQGPIQQGGQPAMSPDGQKVCAIYYGKALVKRISDPMPTSFDTTGAEVEYGCAW